MTKQVAAKWRPTLGMVVFAVLMTVLALPLVSLFFFRLYENELIRQTEAELIAQSAALAAIFAQQVEALPELNELPGAQSGPHSPHSAFRHFLPPSLDLTSDRIHDPRPEALPASKPAAPPFIAIGQRLQGVAQRTQSVTLAGFRLLDPQGVVIAGREEMGLSLAHVEEVTRALQGHYKAVMRRRISNDPTPPLYSLSRGTGVRVFTALPVILEDRVAGVIYASRTPNNIIKHIYDQQRKFVVAGISVLGATLIIGFIFSRAITRPIHALVARTAEVDNHRREALQPPVHHGTREIALLSQSFIDMTERLHERSDYIATFAAHVSHELKTPLTAIHGAAELLRDDAVATSNGMTLPERLHFLDNIIADTSRLTLMLHRLRDLARAENLKMDGTTTLSAVVVDLMNGFSALNIQAEGPLDSNVAMSSENLLIAFSHLADNAARHHAATLRISASAQQGEVIITLLDDGEGVSAANRARIFEAFFTTRRDSGGTGMGLGIVQAMLRSHGGSIRLLTPDRGTGFEIRLPAA